MNKQCCLHVSVVGLDRLLSFDLLSTFIVRIDALFSLLHLIDRSVKVLNLRDIIEVDLHSVFLDVRFPFSDPDLLWRV